jgi:HPr kinase/phosphorylase
MVLIHATSISINQKGVLLRGPSGVGKSDLAFRLISMGASLIADDYTEVSFKNDDLILSSPSNIQGLIELRGIGIVNIPFKNKIVLKLIIDLVDKKNILRIPDLKSIKFENKEVPYYQLSAFECSTPEKIQFLLKLIE